MTAPVFAIRKLEAFCYRYPLSTPVVTSFGRMLNRPAVFVRAEDEDGVVGWGEVWSNFPSTGAEHRARLINEVLALAEARRGPTGVAISVAVPDELMVMADRTRLEQIFALANELGVPIVNIGSGGTTGDEESLKQTIAHIAELTQLAGQHGLRCHRP